MAMPPTLRWALSRLPLRKEEKERLEREAQEARGFVHNLERLLVAVDDSPNGKFASRVAGMIAGTRAMPTTIMHITAARKSDGKSENKQADDKAAVDEQRAKVRAEIAAQILKDAAAEIKRRQPKKDEVRRRARRHRHCQTPRTETKVVAEEAEKGYDLLVVGLDKTTVRDNTAFHANIGQLAAGFDGPLIIVDARDGLLNDPYGRAQHPGAGQRHRDVAARRRGGDRHGANEPRADHRAVRCSPRQRSKRPRSRAGRHSQGRGGARRSL